MSPLPYVRAAISHYHHPAQNFISPESQTLTRRETHAPRKLTLTDPRIPVDCDHPRPFHVAWKGLVQHRKGDALPCEYMHTSGGIGLQVISPQAHERRKERAERGSVGQEGDR